MAYTHWTDVMGNELSASEVMRDWREHRQQGETLPLWLEHSSRETWGSEHKDENWVGMAQEIMRESAKDLVREIS